jgi:hypothetical protein
LHHRAPDNGEARRGDEGRRLMLNKWKDESGRIGYLVLYAMGVPIGLLLLLWVLLGDNLIGAG